MTFPQTRESLFLQLYSQFPEALHTNHNNLSIQVDLLLIIMNFLLDFCNLQALLEMECCPVCGLGFNGLSNQKIHPHLKTHGEKETVCDKCGEHFNKAAQHYLHYKNIHVQNTEHVCEQCGKNLKINHHCPNIS